MKSRLTSAFEEITSAENLLEAWREFLRGKRSKGDVQLFAFQLMDNIIALRDELVNQSYAHGEYEAFNISDPKPRNIHKASVRDRLMHHAIYRVLYPFFAKSFIADSYSCQLEKGTHRAMERFRNFTYKVSENNTRTCWVLKGDIRKFFASIDQGILLTVLEAYIPDKKILWLLERVISSFSSGMQGRGLPLGNLTSQLFVNVYMNEFDQFVKHKLKVKYYVRYADDFVVLSQNKEALESLIPQIDLFLRERLNLTLHPDKVSIKAFASGIDFLGWVHFPDHRVLRTATKRRMFKKLKVSTNPASLQSYIGLMSHGNTYKIQEGLRP